MKKVTDFLKPNILIIFGALLFLFYLNYLQYTETTLAIGIIATVMAVYYLAIGILGIIIGDKLPKKIFDVISVCLFPVFMFVMFLISVINCAQIDGFMGPTAWIIAILSMVASLALAAIYPLGKFLNKPILVRFTYLFAAIFALVLLLNILFDARGDSIVLGNINLILVAIYITYCFYLFSALSAPVEEAPKEVEEKKEEPVEEEKPAEEAQAE